MAVYSMTGYAGASSDPANEGRDSAGEAGVSAPAAGSAHIELRSVNSRFLDLAFRLPEESRGLETALRELLSAHFRRGKIELKLTLRGASESAWPQVLPEQLHRMASLESMVKNWLPQAAPLSVNEVLGWCRQAHAPAGAPDEQVLLAAQRAVAALKAAREREGAKLVSILQERLSRLAQLADQAEPLIPAVVDRQQRKFVERWREAIQLVDAGASVSAEQAHERALNEAAAFAVRIDVAEELARLRAHIQELQHLLKKGGELGKRLDFLIQELLREANTLASKAASLELTNLCVDMKVVIEQLREQVQNIE
jgi:uncharacterized protein (TIGR00255 family)